MNRVPALASIVVAASGVSMAAAPDNAPAPRSVIDLIGSAESWSAQELALVATTLQSPSYLFVPFNNGKVTVDHSDGLMRIGKCYGEIAQSGAVLEPGAYWNYSTEPAFIRIGDATAAVEVPVGALIITGDLISDVSVAGVRIDHLPPLAARERAPGSRVTIACGTGYYACCNFGEDGAPMTAMCVSSEIEADCRNAGGPGSIACALSAR